MYTLHLVFLGGKEYSFVFDNVCHAIEAAIAMHETSLIKKCEVLDDSDNILYRLPL